MYADWIVVILSTQMTSSTQLDIATMNKTAITLYVQMGMRES